MENVFNKVWHEFVYYKIDHLDINSALCKMVTDLLNGWCRTGGELKFWWFASAICLWHCLRILRWLENLGEWWHKPNHWHSVDLPTLTYSVLNSIPEWKSTSKQKVKDLNADWAAVEEVDIEVHTTSTFINCRRNKTVILYFASKVVVCFNLIIL